MGKSSLLIRYVHDRFVEAETINNPVTENYMTKRITMDGKTLVLNLADTTGQEKFGPRTPPSHFFSFRSITSSYYKGSHLVMLCYDITFKRSFTELGTLLQEVERYMSDKAIKCGPPPPLTPLFSLLAYPLPPSTPSSLSALTLGWSSAANSTWQPSAK